MSQVSIHKSGAHPDAETQRNTTPVQVSRMQEQVDINSKNQKAGFPRIVAIVSVYNEVETIKQCLVSLSWCDSIVSHDGSWSILRDDYSSGSDDGTLKILQHLANSEKKIFYEPVHQHNRHDKLKCLLLSGRMFEPDYILWIDGDEIWMGARGFAEKLRKHIRETQLPVYLIPEYNVTQKGLHIHPRYQARLWKVTPELTLRTDRTKALQEMGIERGKGGIAREPKHNIEFCEIMHVIKREDRKQTMRDYLESESS